jgi:cytochrome oxidase Cu insertion factor (SCO1/SenC/PrrC family)
VLSSPRAKLLALLALFALPVVASTLAYLFWPVRGTTNYGELLLPPAVVTDVTLARDEGRAFRFPELRGHWVLVASDSGACPEACRAKLTLMRQVRLALGRNAMRVERVFVADDLRTLDRAVMAAFPGMVVASIPPGMVLPAQPVNDRAHIYLVDPNGNVMMRFPAASDPRRMFKDLDRLLKASQIG